MEKRLGGKTCFYNSAEVVKKKFWQGIFVSDTFLERAFRVDRLRNGPFRASRRGWKIRDDRLKMTTCLTFFLNYFLEGPC